MRRYATLIGASLVGLIFGMAANALAQAQDPTQPTQAPVLPPAVRVAPRDVAPQQPQQSPAGVRRAPQLQLPPALSVQEQTIPVILVFRGRHVTLPTGLRDAALGLAFPEQDHDHDGARAVAHGGTDCDDNDDRRYPGNPEVADDQGHDEDCDFTTIGERDIDGDGFMSWRAHNIMRGSLGQPIAYIRGADCDDSRNDVSPITPEVLGNLRDDNCDSLIDVLDSIGHSEYCAPTAATGVTHHYLCGFPRGDTSQFTPARR